MRQEAISFPLALGCDLPPCLVRRDSSFISSLPFSQVTAGGVHSSSQGVVKRGTQVDSAEKQQQGSQLPAGSPAA